jgi:hypothetical protein
MGHRRGHKHVGHKRGRHSQVETVSSDVEDSNAVQAAADSNVAAVAAVAAAVVDDSDIRCNDETIVTITGDKQEQLIALQKVRAIAQWDQSYLEKNFKEPIHIAVREKLETGEVPPYFHTLCRKANERLFYHTKFYYVKEKTGNSAMSEERVPIKIRLSTKAVQVGVALCKIEGRIPSFYRLDSYLKGFFCEDNVMARESVIDAQHTDTWNFDEAYTKIVTNLVNTPAKMVGHNIEVTPLEAAFQLDMKSGNKLITRSLSRGVVAHCFRYSKFEDNHAIVGNPGIGKSWTLIYALQQALLYENACVLFCFQKKSNALMCIRKNNHIYVWYNKSKNFKNDCDSNLFQNQNVLVLLDPREAKKGGASYTEGARRLIFAASNNVSHFSASPEKVTPNFAANLNPFLDEELQIALKYMSPPNVVFSNEEIESMMQRAKMVGNLPRYLFSAERSSILKAKIEKIVDQLNKKKIAKLFVWDGINTVKTADSLPGAILAVGATMNEVDDGTVDVGYDGNVNVDYGTRKISFLSKLALKKIIEAHRRDHAQSGNDKSCYCHCCRLLLL